MTTVLTTVEGWGTTVRTIRWSGLLLPATVAAVAVSAIKFLRPSDPAAIALVADMGLAVSPLAVAFLADDGTREAVPGSPVSIRSRLAARAAVMVPVAIVGWLLVLRVSASIAPTPSGWDAAGRALPALGLGAAALGVAALASRWPAVPSPGAAGIAVVVAVDLALHALPKRWLGHLPPAEAACAIAVCAAFVAVKWATREPATS